MGNGIGLSVNSSLFLASFCVRIHLSCCAQITLVMCGMGLSTGFCLLDRVERKVIRLINDHSVIYSLQSFAHLCPFASLSLFWRPSFGFCFSELASSVPFFMIFTPSPVPAATHSCRLVPSCRTSLFQSSVTRQTTKLRDTLSLFLFSIDKIFPSEISANRLDLPFFILTAGKASQLPAIVGHTALRV